MGASKDLRQQLLPTSSSSTHLAVGPCRQSVSSRPLCWSAHAFDPHPLSPLTSLAVYPSKDWQELALHSHSTKVLSRRLVLMVSYPCPQQARAAVLTPEPHVHGLCL